jgi:hypothetical protein
LATAKAKLLDVITSKPAARKEVALLQDQYGPGDNVATDQFVVKTGVRLQTGIAREAAHNCFHGGAIFQDIASNLVRVQPQVSLGAGETVIGKSSFEDWIRNLAGVLAKNYHSNNGIFLFLTIFVLTVVRRGNLKLALVLVLNIRMGKLREQFRQLTIGQGK